jgi:hypothetical protein
MDRTPLEEMINELEQTIPEGAHSEKLKHVLRSMQDAVETAENISTLLDGVACDIVRKVLKDKWDKHDVDLSWNAVNSTLKEAYSFIEGSFTEGMSKTKEHNPDVYKMCIAYTKGIIIFKINHIAMGMRLSQDVVKAGGLL